MLILKPKDALAVASDRAGPRTAAGDVPKPMHVQAPAVLIITAFRERFALLGASATVVRTCREGMELIDQRRFTAIFCDMGRLGPLGPQESGFRFSLALKKRQGVPPVFLMSDQVTIHDGQWARRQGAEGLISRSMDAMQAALSRLPSGPLPGITVSAPADPARVAVAALDRVTSALRLRIGPVADLIVQRTLDAISKRYAGSVPMKALAAALSNYIEDAQERARFLVEMGV